MSFNHDTPPRSRTRYHAHMKPKVYLETSVISYFTAPSRKEARAAAFQQATHQWFTALAGEYDLFTSQLVAEEAAAGNRERARERLAVIELYPRLLISTEVRTIAPYILRAANLPPGALADALHIGLAALNGMDYVLTWNMRHIANEDVRQRLRAALAAKGIVCPKLSTPLEFLE